MPGVFRRSWFPRGRNLRLSVGSINATLNFTGIEAVSAVGGMGESNLVPLVGQSAEADISSFSFIISHDQHMTGISAGSAVGGMHESFSRLLTGQSAHTGIAHFLSRIDAAPVLTGLHVTASFGMPTAAREVFLVGQAAHSAFSDFSQNIYLTGQQVMATVGSFSDAGIPTFRVFIVSGKIQDIVSPGVAMYPTSDTINLGSQPYIIGSSQFYTVGEVHWNSTKQVQGVNWEFSDPFNHIVHLLTPPATGTPITLLYYRWNIGVTAGFEVTDYPVPFSFINTTIVAEDIPPLNSFFTVNFVRNRVLGNPFTVMALYPLIVDDMLTDHTLYDLSGSIDTYRPSGFTVMDTSDMTVYEWNGSAWNLVNAISSGTQFYVKRLNAIFQNISGFVFMRYEAGDGESISYPSALVYPPNGEGIGKNLLVDAFSSNAAVDYPAAYQVALAPGDFDPWVVG